MFFKKMLREHQRIHHVDQNEKKKKKRSKNVFYAIEIHKI